jgi:hypothetical protein
MSTVMHPVGSKPPNIYWRRRVAALVVLLLVVLLLTWAVRAVAGLFAPDPAPAAAPADKPPATAAPVADPSASASLPPSAAPTPACDATSLKVEAVSDSRTYKLGSSAQIGMTITNTGTGPCSMDAGSAALELVISSGSDRVWSSDDCQTTGESRPTVIEPNGVLESKVAWNLERSSQGCGTDLSALKAGTYQLVARAGDLKSTPLSLTIQG